MADAYCSPDWHEDQLVEADYMLAALERSLLASKGKKAA